jgi:hypothetical protein
MSISSEQKAPHVMPHMHAHTSHNMTHKMTHISHTTKHTKYNTQYKTHTTDSKICAMQHKIYSMHTQCTNNT